MREASQLALLEPVTSITAESTYSTTLDLPRQGAAMIILSQQRPVTGRDALTRIEAEDYDGQSSATKEASNDESMGQSITASDGGYLYFSQVDFSDAGVDGVQLRVNSQGAATVELRTDSPDGTLLGTCEVAATGDQWETQACALTPTTGVHPLYAVFGGGMRLNWLLFDSSAGEDGSEATDDGTGAGGGAGSDDGGETMPDAADDAAGGMAGASGAADAAGDPTATGAGGSSTGAADDTAAADDTVGTPATTDDSVPTGDTSTAGTTADGTTTVDTTTGSAPPPGGAAAAAGMPSASSSAGAMPEVASTVDEGGDSGCGCRITAPRGAPVGLWGLLGLCALGLMRRRRLC
jgi:MYXO-CTERM domain-containing protein